MDNDAAYADGLLERALDPSTQPADIREFLADESSKVRELLPPGARVVDLGCGTGRHLMALDAQLGASVGIDYQMSYLREAQRACAGARCSFVLANATAVPLTGPFDAAICLTNTWGTMSDRSAVLSEMRRLSPDRGTRLLTVYSPESIEARRVWYANMGHGVLRTTADEIIAKGGFRSAHFSKDRLRELIGFCQIHAIGQVGYLAQF